MFIIEYKLINIDNIKEIYYIYEDGKIFSLYKQDYLKPYLDKDGYLRINLRTKDNSVKYYRIASLVGRCFIGETPDDIKDITIDHIDGNKLNNHYTNLRWMERSENSKIRQIKLIGEKNPSVVLSENKVYEICELLQNSNKTLKEIADLYGVHKSTISNIKRKKNWIHICSYYNFENRKVS